MELEKLQQSWQKLSARLERHEMLKKEELRNFFENISDNITIRPTNTDTTALKRIS